MLIYWMLRDLLKYKLDNPNSMPPWKRWFLTEYAKVREIPDLIDLLEKHTRFRHTFIPPPGSERCLSASSRNI